MSEGTAMNNGADMDEAADTDEAAGMDVQGAAVIVREADERAKRELRIRRPALFVTWGLAFLISYGAVWLSVRAQRPYAGPTTPALVAVFLVGAFTLAVTVVLVGRAVTGVGGWSARQRRTHLLAFACGYAAVFALEGALFHAGASRPVIGVFGAAAPMLVIGLAYAATSTIRLEWPVFGLGIWLIAAAAFSGFAGPVGVWAVGALAGGLAFLLMAAVGLAHNR
jgi:hypothetical protein